MMNKVVKKKTSKTHLKTKSNYPKSVFPPDFQKNIMIERSQLNENFKRGLVVFFFEIGRNRLRRNLWI
jgi:hypothetical protein